MTHDSDIFPAPIDAQLDIALAALWRPRWINQADSGGSVEVLVARRNEGTHLGGFWEFPGGKCEPGERPEIAAAREVCEEVGLTIHPTSLRLLMTVEHTYPDRRVRLHAFIGRAPRGMEPIAIGAAECRWVAAAELASLQFPPANELITRAVIAHLDHLGSSETFVETESQREN